MSTTRFHHGDATAPSVSQAREHHTTSLSLQLWDGAVDLYRAIEIHPFLQELADGTLPRPAFWQYLVQDGLYLLDYASALRVLAARAPDRSVARMLARHAEGAVAAESALQDDLLRELAADAFEKPAVASAQPSPTTLAYTSYLLAVVRGGSFAEGLAAVLPCYWIYWEVGTSLVPGGSPDPLYARWIETYGGAGFGDVTKEVLTVVDALGPEVDPAELGRMHHHYRTASRYEWMFWDAAYRREGWPL